MAQMTLMMPTSLTEQQKIGEFFESLDNLITLHHLKLEKLKNIKQSLLQNMFV
jgi:type I restriction enzyme S subunit